MAESVNSFLGYARSQILKMLLHKNYCPLKAPQIFVEGNFPDEKGRIAIRQTRRASRENRLLPVALPGQLRSGISMRAE
jgi:hypothetical protein